MATIGSLNLKLALSAGGFVHGLSTAESKLSGFGSSVNKTLGSLSGVGGAASGAGSSFATLSGSISKTVGGLTGVGIVAGVASAAVGALTSAVASVAGAAVSATMSLGTQLVSSTYALGAAAVDAAADWERLKIVFTSFLGSAEAGEGFLRRMAKLGAETPFETKDLISAAQRFLNVGFSAEEAHDMVSRFGDIASAAPEGMAAGLNRVSLALSQIRGKGKVTTQDLNQIAEVGVPIFAGVAKQMGVSVSKIRDLIEKGLVPDEAAFMAMWDLAGTPQFQGNMNKLSRSFTGMLSTLKDNTKFALQDLGQVIIDSMDLKGGVDQLSDMLARVRGSIDEFKPSLALVGAAFVAMKDIAFEVLGDLLDSFKNLGSGAGTLEERIAAVRMGMIDFAESSAIAVSDVYHGFRKIHATAEAWIALLKGNKETLSEFFAPGLSAMNWLRKQMEKANELRIKSAHPMPFSGVSIPNPLQAAADVAKEAREKIEKESDIAATAITIRFNRMREKLRSPLKLTTPVAAGIGAAMFGGLVEEAADKGRSAGVALANGAAVPGRFRSAGLAAGGAFAQAFGQAAEDRELAKAAGLASAAAMTAAIGQGMMGGPLAGAVGTAFAGVTAQTGQKGVEAGAAAAASFAGAFGQLGGGNLMGGAVSALAAVKPPVKAEATALGATAGAAFAAAMTTQASSGLTPPKFGRNLVFKADLMEKNRTPLETFQKQMGKLNQELMNGTIGWELYSRAGTDAFQDLVKASKAMEVHLPSIATEGSKEAASAILQFQAQAGAEDPAAVLKRIEKLEERQRELLKEIADKILRLDPPKIKEANFI